MGLQGVGRAPPSLSPRSFGLVSCHSGIKVLHMFISGKASKGRFELLQGGSLQSGPRLLSLGLALGRDPRTA